MFEIGQKVVCVKQKECLTEGEIYTVKDLNLCPKCKVLLVHIGIKTDFYHEGVCICKNIIPLNGLVWHGHTVFKPLDDLYNEEIEELMQEVYEKQPFEL